MIRSSLLENSEIEELKFVEHHQTTSKYVEEETVTMEEFEKRRLVTFASSPLLTRVMSSVEEERKEKEKVLERVSSVKKMKPKRGSLCSGDGLEQPMEETDQSPILHTVL